MDSIAYKVLRVGRIDNVNVQAGTCQVVFLDRIDERPVTVPLPHPYAGAGTGIYAAPRPGTHVLLGFGYRNQAYVVSLLSSAGYTSQIFGQPSANYLDSDYLPVPNMRPGEIVVKGFDRTYLKLSDDGNLSLNFGFGGVTYDSDDFIVTNTNNTYTSLANTQVSSGEIRRDLNASTSTVSALLDRRINLAFEDSLTTISRDPTRAERLTTSNLTGGAVGRRNPPLAESREVFYEYSRDFGVLDPGAERTYYEQTSSTVTFEDFSRREYSRTDTLNTNPSAYNNLAEIVIGTVVDIYGNVLDINRNIVSFAEAGLSDQAIQLDHQLALLRRSIKYHFEINSRKQADLPEVTDLSGPDLPIAPLHSRWSIDVDGEGLTKMNIPASSNIGNIPVPTRYVTAAQKSGDFSHAFRDGGTKDQYHIAYAQADGVAVSASYAPDSLAGPKINAGTVYHSIDFSDILSRRSQFPGGMGTYEANWQSQILSATTINNEIGSVGPNAGGRSVFATLDGSLEMSVGRDFADNKSIVLDTSGSLVGRLGKDHMGNSVSLAADGSVNIVLGASKVRNEDSNPNPTFKIHVESGGKVATVEIDDGNIYIRSAPGRNLVLESSNNLILSAKGSAIMTAENIGLFGTFESDGSSVTPERLVLKTGKPVM